MIDHIGVVVRSLERGIRQWEEQFGYRRNSDIVTNSRQQVKVVFLAKKDSVAIKLLEPSSEGSPVALFARKGGGLHHICFRCADMKAEISRLTSTGARMLVPPQPGEAFRNKDIAFLFAENNLNIEIIDTTEKQGWKEDI